MDFLFLSGMVVLLLATLALVTACARLEQRK
jgi:hypothetical protein